METIAATNHVEAPQVDSGSSELSSQSSISCHISESFTRIDREFYKAAVEGNFNKFINIHNIECLLTPNKNTILHVHLTSTITATATTRSVSKPLDRQIQGMLLDQTHIEAKTTISKHFVERILEKCGGLLVLLTNAKGESPLHLVARYGHYTITKLLLEHARTLPHHEIESGIVGIEKELLRARTHENKDTALHEAVRGNHIEVVEILLEMDPDLSNIANQAKETPLYLASERQYTKIVQKILEKVESPAYEGPNNRTALHAAVINCDPGLTSDLMKNEHLRAAIKHPDKEGWVPLHYAVEGGNEFLTKFLLEQDENTAYMQDNKGRIALHIAAHCNHWVIFEMIIRYYPDCSELVDNKGWNALHYALNKECYRTLDRIMHNLSLSNLYNEKDGDGNTPLHHVTDDQMNNLISHPRVDKLALNKKDQTALDVVCTTLDSDRPGRNQNLIWLLERVGAKRSQRLHIKSHDTSAMLVLTEKAKESHLIVATLIATVTFAAAFTLPGGTIQDGEHKGSPILGHKASFKAFIVSNTIALIMSASAALIHLLSPLKKAKWLDLYLSEVAFSLILVAIATMIVAFGTAMYVVLGSSSIGTAVIIVGSFFFLIFRQVLRMSFKGNSLGTFVGILTNVISFSFIRISPEPLFGIFYFLFNRTDQAEEIKEASSTSNELHMITSSTLMSTHIP